MDRLFENLLELEDEEALEDWYVWNAPRLRLEALYDAERE